MDSDFESRRRNRNFVIGLLAAILVAYLIYYLVILSKHGEGSTSTAFRNTGPVLVYSQNRTKLGEIDFQVEGTAGIKAVSDSSLIVLDQVRSFVKEAVNSSEVFYRIRVDTTIDTDLQDAFQADLTDVLSKYPKELQGAVVAIDRSGAIRAYVGNRYPKKYSDFNFAVNIQRTTGSMFLPFVYAAAIEKGQLEELDSLEWQKFPQVAQQIGGTVGFQPVVVLASSLYFRAVPNSAAVFEGDFNTSLTTLTSAYTSFVREGSVFSPYMIEQVEDYSSTDLFQNKLRSEHMFNDQTAEAVYNALPRDPADKSVVVINQKADNGHDDWFVVIHKGMTVGVWVGYEVPKPIGKESDPSIAAEVGAKVLAVLQAKQKKKKKPSARKVVAP